MSDIVSFRLVHLTGCMKEGATHSVQLSGVGGTRACGITETQTAPWVSIRCRCFVFSEGDERRLAKIEDLTDLSVGQSCHQL